MKDQCPKYSLTKYSIITFNCGPKMTRRIIHDVSYAKSNWAAEYICLTNLYLIHKNILFSLYSWGKYRVTVTLYCFLHIFHFHKYNMMIFMENNTVILIGNWIIDSRVTTRFQWCIDKWFQFPLHDIGLVAVQLKCGLRIVVLESIYFLYTMVA